MNVNQKIEKALSGMAGGNIWPLSCPLEELPGEYIVYLPELEAPEDFGDNADLAWSHHMQVHWFKKEGQKKPVNYIAARKEIRRALKAAGFAMSEILVFFEKDTGYTHLVFVCSIEEE